MTEKIIGSQLMDKRNCYVKIIVNPQATMSFSLRFELYPKKDVNLKIMLPNVNEINTIIEEIKKQIPIKYNFDVQFNWKNIPQILRDNKKFQEDILKIFSSGLEISKPLPASSSILINSVNSEGVPASMEYKKLASILKMHIEQFGAAPDFRNNFSEKNKTKIYNYIKSNMAMPKLTMEQALHIADEVVSMTKEQK